MPRPKLQWQQHSYKSWSAKLGPLSIEVRRIGKGDDAYWCEGEILGSHFLGRQCGPGTSLETAQAVAERAAAKALLAASEDARRLLDLPVGRIHGLAKIAKRNQVSQASALRGLIAAELLRIEEEDGPTRRRRKTGGRDGVR